jgi:TonB family protein
VSGVLHGLLAAGLIAIFFHPVHEAEKVEITVIDAPVTAKPVNISSRPEPKKIEKKIPRAVFGISRKSITSDDAAAETVKAGNTLAKAPDQEKLKPEDADQLPIPTEEYLVTQMPRLSQEVRIPYPAEAKRKGAQGSVVMDILIDAMGKVRDAKLVQGPEESMNQAALEAVHGFKFQPALIQDRAVAVRIRYAYRFVLER